MVYIIFDFLRIIIFKIISSIGWAYDLKVVSNPMICKRALRTGDGSYDFAKHGDFKAQPVDDVSKEFFNMDHENMLWGWRDKDLPEVAKEFVDIRNRLNW